MRKDRGITLIALVVTIIVLLILAGISISMLTGQNGILNRATEAKEETEKANTEEKATLNKYEDIINQYASSLPETNYTKPYLPNSTFKYIQEDLNSGIVIQDANENEYVWIEVPKTIYKDEKYNENGIPSSSDDWESIEKCLKEYTKDYLNLINININQDYMSVYQEMLKSVYENGGFWLGRYESGTANNESRKSHTEITDNDKMVVKRNMYPYTYVTRDEAQMLAEGMNYNNCKSSLMFNIQWNLTMKFIEEKKVSSAKEDKENVRNDIKRILLSDSTNVGNYNNNLWNITNAKAKYSKNNGLEFISCPEIKNEKHSFLLTTGASDNFSLMNIYDLAGNVREWIFEYTNSYDFAKGGDYGDNGKEITINSMGQYDKGYSFQHMGFRITLWK